MAKITKVPDGPLVKKKGPFKGSTLKAGGKIKKAQTGEFLTKEDGKYTSTKKVKTKNGPRYYQGKSPNMSFARELAFDKALKINDSIPKAKLSARALEVMNQKNGGKIKKAANGTTTTQTTTPPAKKSWNQMSVAERTSKRDEVKAKEGREGWSKYMDSTLTADFKKGAERRGLTVEQYAKKVKNDDKVKFSEVPGGCGFGKERTGCARSEAQRERWNKQERNRKNGGPIKKAKSGAMIKRADGSMSKPGLWDNIRKNKGSGKKPTAAMLKQEKKIKAKK
jgi:hypothetical protein